MVYGWVDAIRTSTELIPFVHYENSSLTDEKYDEILRSGCPWRYVVITTLETMHARWPGPGKSKGKKLPSA
jgi:hypothetical protein